MPRPRDWRDRRGSCVYCGEPADASDHVVPLVYAGTMPRRRYKKSTRGTVPSCRECNGLLGTVLLTTFADRAAYVARRLAEKYRRILNGRTWSDAELQDVSPAIRSNVLTAEETRTSVRRRIRCAEAAAEAARAPRRQEALAE